jgi:hypothetical protein
MAKHIVIDLDKQPEMKKNHFILQAIHMHEYIHSDVSIKTAEFMSLYIKTACDISLLHSTLKQFGIHAVTNGTRKEQYIEQVVYEKDVSN